MAPAEPEAELAKAHALATGLPSLTMHLLEAEAGKAGGTVPALTASWK